MLEHWFQSAALKIENARALVSKCCSKSPYARPSLADLVNFLEENLDLIDGVVIAVIKNRIEVTLIILFIL